MTKKVNISKNIYLTFNNVDEEHISRTFVR